MSQRRPRSALPIRVWFGLALVCIFIIPTGLTGFAVYHLGFADDPESDLNDATALLRDNADRWSDPAWRETATEALAADGMEFVLLDGDQEFYRSGAGRFGDAVDENGDSLVRRISAPDAGGDQVAYIIAPQDSFGGEWPPGEDENWAIPFIPLSALLGTLLVIAWLLGRTVVHPLAATNQAAHQVAGGDLDVELPSSRVREVAELNATFEAMSEELGASLKERTRLEEERRLFVSAIAHDLRTPLFSLRGSLQGLEQGVADTPEKRERYITIAQERARALERLISDLFDFTRMEYLDQEPAREVFNLDDLLRQQVDEVQPRARAEEIAVEFASPGQPCALSGDSHLLSRVIGNLLDNALWFTPAGGQVRVTCQMSDGDASFTISDSGPGIPPEDLPHLFTPMFRGETSRSRRTGGAGLGLTIARRIMRAHGGDLEAANTSNGGAVFTGTLPVQER